MNLRIILGTLLRTWVAGELFDLKVIVPANVMADKYIPWNSSKLALFLGEKPLKIKRNGDFVFIENMGSGEHHIKCTKQ